jgi:anti-sigma factor RsiW
MTAEIGSMSCQDFVELVTDYLEGALDPETRARFEHHVDLCRGCEAYLRQMEETAARLGSIPVESLTHDAQTVLLDAFRGFKH